MFTGIHYSYTRKEYNHLENKQFRISKKQFTVISLLVQFLAKETIFDKREPCSGKKDSYIMSMLCFHEKGRY